MQLTLLTYTNNNNDVLKCNDRFRTTVWHCYQRLLLGHIGMGMCPRWPPFSCSINNAAHANVGPALAHAGKCHAKCFPALSVHVRSNAAASDVLLLPAAQRFECQHAPWWVDPKQCAASQERSRRGAQAANECVRTVDAATTWPLAQCATLHGYFPWTKDKWG